MKILRYILIFVLFFSGFDGKAQYTFVADTTSGCDSLRVTFEFRTTVPVNTDTITVEWDFGNGQTASGTEDQTVFYDEPRAYTVSITVNGTPMNPKRGHIKVYPTPSARFTASDSLELGSFVISFIGARQSVDTLTYDYYWNFGDGDTASTRTRIHTFPEVGDYMPVFRVSMLDGLCTAQWARNVTVRDSLDCPNVFTPNEDGINDYFIVSSNGVTIYNMQVFSRSGVLVYKAEAPILIWDGRNLSGQELLPGTYYYVIRPANGSGRFEKKGFVELFR